MGRWQQIESIYQAAADLDPAERAVFLDQACGTDAQLLKEVQDLLAAGPQVDSAVEAAIQKEAEELASRESESAIGKRIGPYRVTAVIAAGGMGTVYRAVRDDDQFRKEVAIKVVKRGMDSEAVLNRFRRERQILAQLDHPYIARLLDGGATETGQPYFVMEYVEGRPLNQHCADRPLEERLGFFRQVCAAVQYAHQNLIVHRDLKPGNILVTKDGVPKLLDFGLAKLLNPDQVPERTFTMVRILTPDYASPEQVRGEAITTASDIYSLGAVLYELVSGRRAHQFQNRTHSELERVICQTDPPALDGELGSIVQMAMRKEPQRRYATVEQLSEDVRRYLEGLPVSARKDTLFYTARKFVRRNRWGVLAAAVTALSLVIGTVVATVEARRAERRFRQVREITTTILLDVPNKLLQIPGTIAVREQLIQTGLRYLNTLAEEAAGDESLQLEVARGYVAIGELQFNTARPSVGDRIGAMKSFQRAQEITERLVRNSPANRDAQATLATSYRRTGELTEDPAHALNWLRKTVVILESLQKTAPASHSSNLNGTRCSMVRALIQLGDFREALATLRGCQHPFREAEVLTGIGDVKGAVDSLLRLRPGDLTGGQTYTGSLWQARRHLQLASLYGDALLLNLGDRRSAIEHCREGLSMFEALAALEPKEVLVRYSLGLTYALLGALQRDSNMTESVQAYGKAIVLRQELIQSYVPDRAASEICSSFLWTVYPAVSWCALSWALASHHAEMSLPLRKLGRRQEAREHLDNALAIERSISVPRAFTRNEMGDLLLESGEREKALDHYRAALAIAEQAVTARPQDMQLRRELADCYERLGAYHATARQWSEARDWYRKSLTVWQEWTKWGVSSVYDQRRAREAEQAVEKYGQFLSANSTE